jgi:KEOPS complex subunit Pcc1
MKARAIVHLNFSSKKQLQVVLNALKPEIKNSSTKRSKVDIFSETKKLVLDFKAKDTSALRAAINSYLRLINVAMSLQKLTK